MDFVLTEEQTMICDAARDFLGEASDSRAVRAAMESEAGFDPAVWQQMATELGWCATPIAEDDGGLGLGPVELALILEQMGEHLLCAPFFATVCLAANLLQAVGDREARAQFLPGIAEGRLIASAPLPSTGDWTADRLTARRDGGGWVLEGNCPRVPDGAAAQWLFLPATVEGEGQPGLFAVAQEAVGLWVQPLETWDATRRFASVSLKSVDARRCDDAARVGEGLRRSLALARLYMAAEAVGQAQRCLDLTVAYTAERKQFGRPVGGFQAVKHRCAEMMVSCEAARSAVYGAAAVAAGDADTPTLATECAMARVVAGEAGFYCAAQAIQLHGGVGFTWEYDPQLYFKRAQAASHWLGDSRAVRAEIAANLF